MIPLEVNIANVVVSTQPLPFADVGFSVTAVVGGTLLPNQPCSRVNLQNRLTADDGTTPQENSVWVVIGGVKVFELLPGVSIDVHVTNSNLVSLRSFSGTQLVSGTITPSS